MSPFLDLDPFLPLQSFTTVLDLEQMTENNFSHSNDFLWDRIFMSCCTRSFVNSNINNKRLTLLLLSIQQDYLAWRFELSTFSWRLSWHTWAVRETWLADTSREGSSEYAEYSLLNLWPLTILFFFNAVVFQNCGCPSHSYLTLGLWPSWLYTSAPSSHFDFGFGFIERAIEIYPWICFAIKESVFY